MLARVHFKIMDAVVEHDLSFNINKVIDMLCTSKVYSCKEAQHADCMLTTVQTTAAKTTTLTTYPGIDMSPQ